jgi:hypothetical protein
VLNDDGHVFLNLNDGLGKAELRRYLESYCRTGLDTVAYCVGDMSWPTLYPTQVGVRYRALGAGGDLRRLRAYGNVDNFAAEPGGYFGAVFGILRQLGKRVLASFRMNDAHFTSLDNPNVSEFWKQHAKLALGPAYGYYGGCLNYASDAVRGHFFERVVEFADRKGRSEDDAGGHAPVRTRRLHQGRPGAGGDGPGGAAPRQRQAVFVPLQQ